MCFVSCLRWLCFNDFYGLPPFSFSLDISHRWALVSPSKTTYERAPASVLIVYPAMDGVFQRAVVALADFLQSSGTCNVAIDVWQRESLAELGPLRWLHTLAETSNRVLVVLPGRATDCGTSGFINVNIQ